VKQRRLGQSN